MEFLTFIIGIILTLGLTAFLLKQKDFLRIFALAPFMFFVLFVYSLNSDPNIDLYTSERVINGTTTNEEITTRIYAFQVETSTSTVANVNGGGAPAIVRAEFIPSTSSALYNDVIECIDIPIKKTGSPPVGTLVTVGTFDGSGNLVRQFGNSMNVTSLTTATTWYSFCLPNGQIYTLQSGDRIGIKYSAGDGSNKIDVGIDDTNPFDSTVTYRQTYTSSWTSATGGDMTMRLYRGTNATSTETVNTYSDPEAITYTISPFVMTTLNVLTLVMVFIIALFGYRGIIAKPSKGAP